MAEPGIDGVATGNWNMVNDLPHHAKNNLPKTKKELLERWDTITEKINKIWPQIPANVLMKWIKLLDNGKDPFIVLFFTGSIMKFIIGVRLMFIYVHLVLNHLLFMTGVEIFIYLSYSSSFYE